MRQHIRWFRATVCAEQALELHQQADGVQLPEEAGVTQAVPQLDDEAANQRRQLQRGKKRPIVATAMVTVTKGPRAEQLDKAVECVNASRLTV